MSKNLVALDQNQIVHLIALVEAHTETLTSRLQTTHSGADQFMIQSALTTYGEAAAELRSHLPVPEPVAQPTVQA